VKDKKGRRVVKGVGRPVIQQVTLTVDCGGAKQRVFSLEEGRFAEENLERELKENTSRC